MDVVQYAPDVFIERRDKVTPTEKDAQMVQSMLDKYACFKEGDFQGGGLGLGRGPSESRSGGGGERGERGGGRTSRHGGHGHGHGGHSQGHGGRYGGGGRHGHGHGYGYGYGGGGGAPSHRIQKAITYEDKLKREIQGLLNKIADANTPVLLKRFQYILDAKSVDIVLDTILSRCYMHEAYMPFFVTLLEHIHAVYPQQVADRLTHFMETFMNELHCLNIRPDILLVDDYDAFCHFVKTKKHIYGKHMLLIEVIKRNLLADKYEEYFGFIWAFVLKSLDMMQLLEVGASLLVTFFARFKDLDKRNQVRELYTSDIQPHCQSKRIVFTFLKICEPPEI